MRFLYAIANRLNPIIIGNKPHNTLFSFNYHNIKHITGFLKELNRGISKSDIKLLDVGGGGSPYYSFFVDKIESYTVVDMESSLPKNETRPIQQIIGFAEDLPLSNESFDLVLSNQVLEHVIDERLAVKESFRVLKPGGIFVGSVPHLSPIHLEPYDFRRFTEFGLRKLLKDEGFIDITISGNGSVYKAMALSINMERILSRLKYDEEQKFLYLKHFYFSPITAFINILGGFLDYLFGRGMRTPSNYCWVAYKPK